MASTALLLAAHLAPALEPARWLPRREGARSATEHFRKVPLVVSRYNIYYRVNAAKQQIEVLHAWHMSRRPQKL